MRSCRHPPNPNQPNTHISTRQFSNALKRHYTDVATKNVFLCFICIELRHLNVGFVEGPYGLSKKAIRRTDRDSVCKGMLIRARLSCRWVTARLQGQFFVNMPVVVDRRKP